MAPQPYTAVSKKATDKGTSVEITLGSPGASEGLVRASTTPMLDRSSTTTNRRSKSRKNTIVILPSTMVSAVVCESGVLMRAMGRGWNLSDPIPEGIPCPALDAKQHLVPHPHCRPDAKR